MKKPIIITIILILVAIMAGCAPKTNQNPTTDSAKPTPYAVYESFTLYFPNNTTQQLVKENHELRIDKNTSYEKLIMDALKMGPKNEALSSPLSFDAKIHSIRTLSGLCTIDVSENFLNINDLQKDQADLMLHSVVNSLCDLQTIQQVKFNIDGNTAAKINDSLDLSQPFSPDIANL